MQKKKQKRADFYDDGRTVVNMNVEGMPWYHERKLVAPPVEGEPQTVGRDAAPTAPFPVKLQGKERRAFVWGVAKAILVIIALFVVVLGGTILLFLR